jgi:RND family efflux transporter MFP subunit
MKPESTETDWSATQRDKGPHDTSPPITRRTSKFLLYSIPALLLAVFAGLAVWRIETRLHVRAALFPASAESNEIPVSVTHPRRSSTAEHLTLPGNVQAFVETPIYARTDGYLKRWYVDIGGRVKEGQLLATIETPEVDQQLRQAQAAESQAQANLELARTTAERWQNLLKSDGVSQQEVDQNASAYKARQADEDAAKANVQRLMDMKSFQQVTAPFSGVITARDVDIGALISSGNAKQLFRLAQIDILRVYVNVPETYAGDIAIGIPADVHIAEFRDRTFPGRVAHTSGAIDTSSRTLLVEVQVPNPRGELLPGSYAEVEFHLSAGSPPLTVPSSTLVFRSAGPQVVIVDAHSKAHLQTVSIGRDFGASLEILSGLLPTDSVIVNPPDSIFDGTPVAVQPDSAQAPPQPPPQALPQALPQPLTAPPSPAPQPTIPTPADR